MSSPTPWLGIAHSLSTLTSAGDSLTGDGTEVPVASELVTNISVNPDSQDIWALCAPGNSANNSHTYQYTQDLLCLDSKLASSSPDLPLQCTVIVTPFLSANWEAALQSHPDKLFANYIINGIREGFRIGYDHSVAHHRSAKCNMQSALSNPGPVDKYIQQEVLAGRVVQLPEEWETSRLQISRFGVSPNLINLGGGGQS